MHSGTDSTGSSSSFFTENLHRMAVFSFLITTTLMMLDLATCSIILCNSASQAHDPIFSILADRQADYIVPNCQHFSTARFWYLILHHASSSPWFSHFMSRNTKSPFLFPDDADLNNARLLYIVLCCMTLAQPTRLLGT